MDLGSTSRPFLGQNYHHISNRPWTPTPYQEYTTAQTSEQIDRENKQRCMWMYVWMREIEIGSLLAAFLRLTARRVLLRRDATESSIRTSCCVGAATIQHTCTYVCVASVGQYREWRLRGCSFKYRIWNFKSNQNYTGCVRVCERISSFRTKIKITANYCKLKFVIAWC